MNLAMDTWSTEGPSGNDDLDAFVTAKQLRAIHAQADADKALHLAMAPSDEYTRLAEEARQAAEERAARPSSAAKKKPALYDVRANEVGAIAGAPSGAPAASSPRSSSSSIRNEEAIKATYAATQGGGGSQQPPPPPSWLPSGNSGLDSSRLSMTAGEHALNSPG